MLVKRKKSSVDIVMEDTEGKEKLPPPAIEYIPADVQTKEEEHKERGESVKATIEDAAMNTGAHGIANIYRTHSVARRVFWCIIFFAGLGIMLWQVSVAVLKYLEYPTVTTIDYKYATNLAFPAITICNNNPYVLSRIENYTALPELFNYLDAAYDTWTNAWDDNATQPTEFETWEDVTDPPGYDYDYDDYDYGDDDYDFYTGTENADFDFVEDFLNLLSTVPLETKKSLGHDLDDMIIDCTWQGKDCKNNMFYQFHNYLYGNCYTFNSGRNSRVLKTSKEGPLFAFKLSLFVDQDDYIPGVSDGAGIRLVVHNQGEMPLPDEQGFNLKPGTKTSVGITRRVVKRLGPPWGDCKDYDGKNNRMNNAYINHYEDVGYSVAACKKTCYQKALLDRCHCFDYKVPADYTLDAFEGAHAEDTQYGCYADDQDYVNCRQETSLKFINDELDCKERCKDKCLEVEYVSTMSSLEWPSVTSTDRILSQLAEKSDYFWDKITNDSWTENDRKLWVRENFVKLEVYFKTFNYELIKQKKEYEWFQLISDFGGQVGLWLGLSMIAIFELVEFISDLIVICVKRIREKRLKRQRVKDEEQTDGQVGQKWAMPSKENSMMKEGGSETRA